MPQFAYKARTEDGRIAGGRLEGADRRQIVQKLKTDGLSPVSIRELKGGRASFLEGLRERLRSLQPAKESKGAESAVAGRGGSPGREAVGLAFLKRLLELHSSGLPVGDAIRILSQRLSNPEQRELANATWRDLSEGGTLAGAMTRRSKYFAGSIAYVIEAGEATGHLAPVLRKVIEYLEEKQAIRKKMLTSMAYPAFVCSIAVGVVVLFLLVLLPQIQGMLDRLGSEMTWSARLLIDGSDFLVRFGPFLLVGLFLGAVALRQWRKTERGLQTTDRWLLRLPLIGKITFYADLFQAGNLISTLLQSGINTTETLRLTERTVKNTAMRERFRTARNQVNEGLSVAQAFKRNAFMPDLALDILAVGENTGNLSESMDEITRSFRDELTARLTRLTGIVSSGALVAAFILVTLIALGIVTSVFQVSRTLSV